MKLLRGQSAKTERVTDPAAGRDPAADAVARDRPGEAEPTLANLMNSSRGRVWLAGLLLVAAVVIAYQPVWHAGFIWDDDAYVTANPLLTAPDGLKRIWFSLDSPSQYFPLVYTMFRFERTLWGLDPAGYHWVNILLQAVNALLVWRVLKRLRVPGSWLAAAIFALHPVQVETVAWIAERKNLLVLLFSLLTVRAWIEFVDERRKVTWPFYLLALFFYLLALFSKTTACTLPAALLLVMWWKGQHIGGRRLAQIIPFVLAGIGMGLVTVWWEQHHQGVAGKLVGYGLLDRVLIASRALWFYAGKLVWPAGLCFSYPHWTIRASDPLAYGWLLAGMVLAGLILYCRRRLGRGVEVAALFYVVTLSPLLGFFMLSTFEYSFVADHYQYVASIGPLALAAAGITAGLRRLRTELAVLAPTLSGVLVVVLGALTWSQSQIYLNRETLWRATLARNPDSFLAANNLAGLLTDRGDIDEAITYYHRALAMQPPGAKVEFNLGLALFARGRIDEAIASFRKALEIQPDGASIAYNLGKALFAKGQVNEAIHYYRLALQLQPDAAATECDLGNALLARGQSDEAIAYLERAVSLAPSFARARSSLGNALASQGRFSAAITQYERALELQPDSAGAHNNLANALLRGGRIREAIKHYQAALELRPDNVSILHNLTWVLATSPERSVRDGARAIELGRRADRLSGGKSPEVLRALSAAFAEAGRFPEAIATTERALQLPKVQSVSRYADSFQAELKRYEAGEPLRDLSLTNASPAVKAQ